LGSERESRIKYKFLKIKKYLPWKTFIEGTLLEGTLLEGTLLEGTLVDGFYLTDFLEEY
jgi:hypothetical protein